MRHVTHPVLRITAMPAQATEDATSGGSRDAGRKKADPQRKQVPPGEDTWRRCRFGASFYHESKSEHIFKTYLDWRKTFIKKKKE